MSWLMLRLTSPELLSPLQRRCHKWQRKKQAVLHRDHHLVAFRRGSNGFSVCPQREIRDKTFLLLASSLAPKQNNSGRKRHKERCPTTACSCYTVLRVSGVETVSLWLVCPSSLQGAPGSPMEASLAAPMRHQ
jgi:hypothetical protein